MIATIQIAGLTIGTYASGYLIRKLSGFSFPEVDVEVKERGNYQGARLGGYRYSRRLMSIDLQIVGSDTSDFETKRTAIEKALTLINGLQTVTFTTKAGVVVTAECIVNSKFEAPYESGRAIISDAQIQLVAPFPYFLGSSESTTVPKATGGGFAIPFGIPLDMSGGGSGATTILNDGNGASYPTITIYGKAENPSLYNETSGKVLSISYTLLTISDNIVLDFYNRTAVLNNTTNVKQYVSGDWWTLLAGNNVVKLTTGNALDIGYADVVFNDSYLGL